MPYKDKEHDGDEDFELFEETKNLQDERIENIITIIQGERDTTAELEKAQDEYLSHENPALWEGEFE